MRNLIIQSISTLPPAISAQLKDAQAMCVDSLNGRLYFATRTSILAVDHNNHVQEIDISDCAGEQQVVFIEFLSDDQQLCVVLNDGTILTVNSESHEVEIVASVPGPIVGGAWSPDLQLLILAAEEELFAISRDFELISQEELRPIQPGKDQLVDVGWGSHTTQFQGTSGKRNRERVDPNKLPMPIDAAVDDGRRIIISWRADAQYFTVSSVDVIKVEAGSIKCRQLRVWDRDLNLMSKCEFLAGIGPTLGMRPTGNLIAVTRLLNGIHSVALFERNGQQRSHFDLCDLPINAIVTHHLLWNIDSTILAIATSSSNGHTLHFFMVSNYDWMEKVRLHHAGDSLSVFIADVEDARCFHTLTIGGLYRKVKFRSNYNCEEMLAVVVNGNSIRVTDLIEAPIPPPMCHYELQLKDTPSSMAFSHQYGVAMWLSEMRQLQTFPLDGRKFNSREGACTTLVGLLNEIYCLAWKDADTLSAVMLTSDCIYMLVEMGITSGDINVIGTLPKSIVWQQFNPTKQLYDVITESGQHLEWTKLSMELVTDFNSAECVKCQRVGSLMVVLTRSHQLFVNGHVLHPNVSSFSVGAGADFLLLTTMDSRLHCIPIPISGGGSELKPPNNNSSRQIERGGVLLGYESFGTRVCLQAARGNLELFHPREMLIERLKRMLDSLEFGQALREMRRHRVDLNLLYDHNPNQFIANVDKLLREVDNTDYLQLFLTSLQEGDCTLEMFASHYPPPLLNSTTIKTTNGKVNSVCCALRTALLEHISTQPTSLIRSHYPLVLSTFVMERPPRVADALNNMRQQLTTQVDNDAGHHQLMASWLKHLSYLVDGNTLFKGALKTYELKIALAVAEASDRDPKEYLPLQNAVRKRSPPAYQRFHIDLWLEDWSSALEHLADSLRVEGDVGQRFEECKQHISKHSLYSKALSVFNNNAILKEKYYEEICRLCADNAKQKKNYSEAALLYLKISNGKTDALACYALSIDYKHYLHLAEEMGLQEEATLAELKKMAIHLEQRRLHSDLADLLEIINDSNGKQLLFDSHCANNEWLKAVESIQGQPLHKQHAITVIHGRCQTLMGQFEEWGHKLKQYSRRLEIVRANKQKQLEQWVMGEMAAGDDLMQSETLSEASSTISNASYRSKLSHASTATAKRRKQIDRKKKTIKEGSQYEDSALLMSLKDIYKAIDAQQDELKTLLPALLMLDEISFGCQLQQGMGELLRSSNDLLPQIWPRRPEAHHLPGPLIEIYRCADGTIRLPTTTSDSLMPQSIQIEEEMVAPTVRTTKECSLEAFTFK